MRINVTFIGSARTFSMRERVEIKKVVRFVSADAAKDLRIRGPIHFTMYRFGNKLQGMTEAKDWIRLTLPVGRIDLEYFASVLYHELHHVARGYTEYLEEGRHFLLNSFFSEGLAMKYEVEKKMNAKRVASCAYSKAMLRRWMPKAKRELRSHTYSYWSWFKGEGKPDRLGYRIGKYLVDEVFRRHPEYKSVDLTQKSASELLKLSGVRF